MTKRVCVDCGANIGATSTRCRACNNKHIWSSANNTEELKHRSQKVSNNNKERWSDPKFRAAKSELAIKQWKDPERRQKLLDGLHSRAARMRMSKTSKEYWNNPERRKAQSERMTEFWDDPERRDAHSKTMIQLHKDGVYDGVFGSPSKLEMGVWTILEECGVEFEAQYHPQTITKIYDIYIPMRGLLIEIDGKYWHSLPGAAENDEFKEEWAIANGYNFLRILESGVRDIDYMDGLICWLKTVM